MLNALTHNEKKYIVSWKRAMEILSELCGKIENAESATIRIPYRTVIWIPRHHDIGLEIFRFFQAVQLFAEWKSKPGKSNFGENDVIITFENIAAKNCRPAVAFLQCNVSPLAQREIIALELFQGERTGKLIIELMHSNSQGCQAVISGCENGLVVISLPETVYLLKDNIWITNQERPS